MSLKRGFCSKFDSTQKFFDLGHFSFNRNKTQTAVTNICLNCITFINLTFRMLEQISSEVVIIQLQVNLNSKNNYTDWELTKLIDIKRQEYANNRDEVSHCIFLVFPLVASSCCQLYSLHRNPRNFAWVRSAQG